MGHAFMPMYWGDYLRDTSNLTTEQHGAYLLLLCHCWQHGAIPLADAERAAVVKLSPRRWKVIKAPVVRLFNEDGTQDRISREIARVDKKVIQAKASGSAGGKRSAIIRAIKRGKLIADAQAELKREAKRIPSERLPSAQAEPQATPQAELQRTRTNQKDKDKEEEDTPSSDLCASGENSTASLATALPTGALRSPSRDIQSRSLVEPSAALSAIVKARGWSI